MINTEKEVIPLIRILQIIVSLNTRADGQTRSIMPLYKGWSCSARTGRRSRSLSGRGRARRWGAMPRNTSTRKPNQANLLTRQMIMLIMRILTAPSSRILLLAFKEHKHPESKIKIKLKRKISSSKTSIWISWWLLSVRGRQYAPSLWIEKLAQAKQGSTW